MFEETHLQVLGPDARSAIEQAVARVRRQEAADDVEGIIGASKDLAESVAKSVIGALGGTYGSDVNVPKLANKTLEVLELHPSGLQDRPLLRKLSQSMISVLSALAELRNRHGTGHGRAVPSDLSLDHAVLAKDAAQAWCRWVLATGARVLSGRAAVVEAARQIGFELLRRGKLPALLEEVGLSDLAPEDQHQLGLAVGRRWSSNRTFLALQDVIEPLASGEQEYPGPFAAGVILGLFFDRNGFLVARPEEIALAVEIARRLPVERRHSTFRELVELAGDAHIALGPEAAAPIIGELNRLSAELSDDPQTASALRQVGTLIENPRPAEAG